MEWKIEGGNLPVLRMTLGQDESVFTGKGAMAWMGEHVQMQTSTKGGFFKGIARSFAGETIFMNTFTSSAPNQELAVSPPVAGEIKHLEIGAGREVLCQKGAFLAGDHTVELGIGFQRKISSGFFGGEGFILQKLSGSGNAFLEIDGALIEKELAPGEVLKVDQGYVAYFDSTMTYEMKFIKGVKNILFGGEGLLIAKLTGPGKVGLQTLPMQKLAMSLYPYMPKPR